MSVIIKKKKNIGNLLYTNAIKSIVKWLFMSLAGAQFH